MTAALGSLAVIGGLIGSIVAIITVALGLSRRDPVLLRTSGRWAWTLFGLAVVAAGAIEVALLRDDFSLRYLAQNSERALPLGYKMSVLWAALEGSIVLWVLILCGYIAATAWWFRARLEDRLVAYAMLTLFVVAAFFFFLLVFPADPFVTLANPPADGSGPNPLLQNHPLMVIHPVMLYLGYVGFTVPFAFAIAALATGRLGEGWLLETRPWTVMAWGFLTVGIVLGAWWSYEVLGWGGYWAWDPVENVSFLPWLTGTAYIHSVVVQERRGMLRVWNLSLLIATFALTILGTFVTRSGVLDSVHEFTASSIGPMLLAFFAAIVGVSLALIFWRGDRLRSPGSIESITSREGSFLFNNLVFTAFAFIVLLGTMFPLLIEAFNGDKLAVGSPYFERMGSPIGMLLLFLMGMAPLLPWRATSPEVIRERALGPAVFAVVVLGTAVAFGADGPVEMIAYVLAGFAGGAALRHLLLAVSRQGIRGILGRAGGGMIVHIGVVIVALGFVASQAHSHEGEFRVSVGQGGEVAGHTVVFEGVQQFNDGDREVTSIAVRVDDDEVHRPAITRYPNFGQPIGTPSVATSLRDDVYITVLDVSDDQSTVLLRVIVRPLIAWLWAGGLLMGFGTLLAMLSPRRKVDEPESVEEAAAGIVA